MGVQSWFARDAGKKKGAGQRGVGSERGAGDEGVKGREREREAEGHPRELRGREDRETGGNVNCKER